ncbi:MAG: cysteine desulfurase [Candidatus Omnitrophica bacterium]|nr:cysteine desulfurase [Candidatus Omnitrophota bacterium]
MQRIYFDYASTAPADPRVIEVMQPYFYTQFGNPASPHAFGREAQKVMEDARQSVARSIGAQPEEVIFNSGATEGNNHALFGISRSCKDKGRHIIISAIEHHSLEAPAGYLAKEGYKITYLPVSREGLVDPQQVQDAITNETILVAVMHANNEIGTIEPVGQIGRITRAKGIPFLVDAVQTVGHIPVNVDELGADLLTMSAHKFYGPKGVGALYIRRKTKIVSFLLGGDQEKGRRASTQNAGGAVGLAKALELCLGNMSQEMATQTRLRDQLLTEIPKRITGVVINGHRTSRLPNNAHFAFEKVSGESLLMSLDLAGICASMGSACKAGAMEPSRILLAIGLPDELAHGALRVTIGRWTTQAHVDCLLERLPQMVKGLRG